MRPFDFAASGLVAEAVALLDETNGMNGPGSALLAGGTDLLTLMKADVVAPSLLIDIKRVGGAAARIEESRTG